jgi:electron transport complex protein RnfE
MRRSRLRNEADALQSCDHAPQFSPDDPLVATAPEVVPNDAVRAALLGLCPLLPVADSLLHGFALGAAALAATALVMAATGVLRRWLTPPLRLPACALIAAIAVSAIDLLGRAFLFELHLSLGIYLPLLVANLAILARALAVAAAPSAPAGPPVGPGEAGAIVLLPALIGGLRELAGRGSLFEGAADLLGNGAAGLVIRLLPADGGFALAQAPAGAFFALALVLTARQALAARRTRR